MRERNLTLSLIAVFALIYLATLCPTVYFGDSGEISSAILTNGVIHPPGYPLLGVLGRAALVLIPFGEAAFRIGCVVALAAALSVGALFRLGRTLGLGVLPALTAAATLGASFTFWNQSVRVEVYSLHVLLSLLTLLFALRHRRTGSERDLLRACLTLSLGLAHHLTILVLLPGLLVLVGKHLWTKAGAPRRLARASGVVLLVGPLLYLLLPLWASDASGHNWTDPSTPLNLWNHVSAKIYRGILALPDAFYLQRGVRTLGSVLQSNLPFGLWLLPLLGLVRLFQRDRGIAWGVVVCLTASVAYNLCYRIPDIGAYYLVSLALLALLSGFFWEALLARMPRAGQVMLALPVALLLHNFPSCNLSRKTLVREFARHKLESCAPSAVLLTQGDHDTNSLDYVRDALGVRRDVLLLDRQYVMSSVANRDFEPSLWYLKRLRAQGVDAPLTWSRDPAQWRALAQDGYLIALLTGPLQARPLATTFLKIQKKDSLWAASDEERILAWLNERYQRAPLGMVVQLQPAERAFSTAQLIAANRRFWDAATLPDLLEVDTREEQDGDYLAKHYVSMLANYGFLYESSAEPEKALFVYDQVLQLHPRLGREVLQKMSPLGKTACQAKGNSGILSTWRR